MWSNNFRLQTQNEIKYVAGEKKFASTVCARDRDPHTQKY
jgi:hypothetical protein